MSGSLGANFIHFLFNIFLSRNLAVQDYGSVASLMAIITLFGISSSAIAPTIVSFTSRSFQENDLENVRSVYFKIFNFFLLLSGIILVIFLAFSRMISVFLNISNGAILVEITGITVFIGFMSMLNLSLFQARLSFRVFSSLNILSAIIKLFLGMVFIFYGFSTVGVMFAILLSYVIPYLLGFGFIKFLFKRNVSNVRIKWKDIVVYAAPSGAALVGLTAISSIDLLLVKHLFDANSAGVYAGLSLLGRVVFFFTAPITVVMFPLMSRKYDKKENYNKVLLFAILTVGVSSFGISLFYFLFPEFVIRLFLKNEVYLNAVPYLGMIGIFASLHSLNSAMMYYFLSIRKTWIYKPIVVAGLLQALGIYLFHDSLGLVIGISILMTALLLIFLSFYAFFLTKK